MTAIRSSSTPAPSSPRPRGSPSRSPISRRLEPGRKVAAAGCLVERYGEELPAPSEVDAFGRSRYGEIERVIGKSGLQFRGGKFSGNPFSAGARCSRRDRRAYLAIEQEGCSRQPVPLLRPYRPSMRLDVEGPARRIGSSGLAPRLCWSWRSTSSVRTSAVLAERMPTERDRPVLPGSPEGKDGT